MDQYFKKSILDLQIFQASNDVKTFFSHIVIQWNHDLTKCQGTGQIASLYRGFVISKTLL